MTTVTEALQCASRYADTYTIGDDPHGKKEDELVSDELFGCLSTALYEVEVQLEYAEYSGSTGIQMEAARASLESALRERARTVLEEANDE